VTLQDRLAREPEIWRPEPGQSLTGTLVEIEMRPSDFGADYPVVTLLDADGNEFVFHAFHTTARTELAKLRPEPGDQIGIRYRGKVEGRKNPYESYRILVERAEPTLTAVPDWDAIAEDADAELDEQRAVSEGLAQIGKEMNAALESLSDEPPATPDEDEF
jgi:hypothetical protein